jgi:Holliday junction resolvasome RuvABC endonuclease subunit
MLPGVELPPVSLRLSVNLWGIDCSTRRIALGVVQGRGPAEPPEIGWFSLNLPVLKGAARLAHLHDALPPFFSKVAAVAPPAGVLVEQPFGQGKARPHPQSYYVVGVVLCALGLDFGELGPVEVVEPSSWKKYAMGEGHGFAKKPAILAWAQRTVGYPGECPTCNADAPDCDHACAAHDEADALGVVTCAAVRWAAGEPLR